LTSIGSDAQRNRELLRRAVTAPRDLLWKGLRIQNNARLEEEQKMETRNVKLFATTNSKSRKLPSFDSPW